MQHQMATLISRAALVTSTSTASLRLSGSEGRRSSPDLTGTASRSSLTTRASSNTIQSDITGRLDVNAGSTARSFSGSGFTFKGATTGTNARTLTFASTTVDAASIAGSNLADKVSFGSSSQSTGTTANFLLGNDSVEFARGSADSGSTYNFGGGQDSVIFKSGSSSSGDTLDLGSDSVRDTVTIENGANVSGLVINNFRAGDRLVIGRQTYTSTSQAVINNTITGVTINPPA